MPRTVHLSNGQTKTYPSDDDRLNDIQAQFNQKTYFEQEKPGEGRCKIRCVPMPLKDINRMTSSGSK